MHPKLLEDLCFVVLCHLGKTTTFYTALSNFTTWFWAFLWHPLAVCLFWGK